jgi:hypothetical protein
VEWRCSNKTLNSSPTNADIERGLGIETPETVIAMTSVALGVVLLALSIIVLVWGFPSLPTRDD